ncbi:hypothetical protein E0Z10_g11030 [Xylaria hypoxylon]|uniref:Uncharacterized protein n=1 Tax=Xylaria hypoxylon TaxID=37992 RepID=A0A4Z0Y6T6_9PEZI|nr:hypothetical protein E0Z10_g11030 [Xylaria hypoxylon]
MVTSIEGEAPKPPQMAVSAKEVSSISSHRFTHERNPDGGFESREDSIPSTPTSAHTINGFDVDIEAIKPAQSQEHLRGASISGNRFNSDSSVWPGQAHWKNKALAAKRKNRSCQWLARLSKRTQIAVKLAIVLLVVGVAVGVGFGISISLGARLWQPKDDQR